MIRTSLIASLILIGCGNNSSVATRVTRKATGQPTRSTAPKMSSQPFAAPVSTAPSRPTSAPAMTPQLQNNEKLERIADSLRQFFSSAFPLGAKADSAQDCSDYGLTDGEGYCFFDGVTSYVIYCDSGSAYALDCGAFGDHIACDEDYLADVVECAAAPATTVDDALLDDQSYAVAVGECAAQEQHSATCSEGYIEYCVDNVLYELDCGAFVDDSGEAATCGAIDQTINCGWDH
jgi:hypothetical protein